jgi:hypothetical protein
MKTTFRTVVATLALAASMGAQAQLRITEVAPYASGNTPFGADWIELTNFGSSALTIDGWRLDDNSNSFAASVPMLGISSIAPGESVIFLECAAGCAAINGFRNYWGAPVAGLQIGTYSGAGVGLGTGGDAVNIFDSTGQVLARVSFGASTVGRTFDNSAGLDNVVITALSALGTNGAFQSVGSLSGGATGLDIGSPGVSAIPEPATLALWLAGLAGGGLAARRRAGAASA